MTSNKSQLWKRKQTPNESSQLVSTEGWILREGDGLNGSYICKHPAFEWSKEGTSVSKNVGLGRKKLSNQINSISSNIFLSKYLRFNFFNKRQHTSIVFRRCSFPQSPSFLVFSVNFQDEYIRKTFLSLVGFEWWSLVVVGGGACATTTFHLWIVCIWEPFHLCTQKVVLCAYQDSNLWHYYWPLVVLSLQIFIH